MDEVKIFRSSLQHKVFILQPDNPLYNIKENLSLNNLQNECTCKK